MAPRRAVPQAQGGPTPGCRFGSPSRCHVSSTLEPQGKDVGQHWQADSTPVFLNGRMANSCECAAEMSCSAHGQEDAALGVLDVFQAASPPRDVMDQDCDLFCQDLDSPSAQRKMALDVELCEPSEIRVAPCEQNLSMQAFDNSSARDRNQMCWEGEAASTQLPCTSPMASPFCSGVLPGSHGESSIPPAAYQGGFFGGQAAPHSLASPVMAALQVQSPRHSLPTIFESEGAAVQGMDGSRGPLSPAAAGGVAGGVPMLSPTSRSRFLGRPGRFPRSARSEPGVRRPSALSSRGPTKRLSPSQPLSAQLSPSLTALLSVLSESEAPGERPGSAGTSRPALAAYDGCGTSDNVGPTHPVGSMYPYRELDVSPSLSALMAILSFENDPESPPGSGLMPSRTLSKVNSGLEASLRELELDSSPRRLLRQSSLDSGICFLTKDENNNKGSRDPSPTGSLKNSPVSSPHASPSVSPARTRNSSLQSTPSPVLQRRITSNRSSAVQECWNAGPMRKDLADGIGLRSVTEMIEEDGTAAFYRGFQTAGGASPASPARSKRSRVGLS